MSQHTNPTCHKCSGKCKQSKAFYSAQFITDNGRDFIAADIVADNGLKDCYKCENCGHSFTVGTDVEFSEFCRLSAELNKILAIAEAAKIKIENGFERHLRFSERNADFIKKSTLEQLCKIYKLDPNNANNLELAEKITLESAFSPSKDAQFSNINFRLKQHFGF